MRREKISRIALVFGIVAIVGVCSYTVVFEYFYPNPMAPLYAKFAQEGGKLSDEEMRQEAKEFVADEGRKRAVGSWHVMSFITQMVIWLIAFVAVLCSLFGFMAAEDQRRCVAASVSGFFALFWIHVYPAMAVLVLFSLVYLFFVKRRPPVAR